MNKRELEETLRSEKDQTEFSFLENKVILKKTYELPVEIGNFKAFLKTEIVEGDIPWLVGTDSLRKMGAIIDLEKEVMIASKLKNQQLQLKLNNMGHTMIPLRKNEQGSLIWIERQSKLWIENEKEWKQHCLRLHLQFGHGSYSKLETMLLKALKGDMTFDKYRKERLKILKRICEECTVCVKYGRTPSRPSVGLH